MTQYFATAAIVQAAPGFRELRIGIRRRGEADAFALIAVGTTHDTADVLAAFGWRLVGDLEYVAGPNEERGEVEPCAPTEGNAGDCVRNTVRREIRARTLAMLAHSTAAHFHPVQLNGDGSRDPIGWTFLATVDDERRHFWVTAGGAIAEGAGEVNRAEAKRAVRHAHMMQLDPSPAAALVSSQLDGRTGPQLAETLHIVRNGWQGPTDVEVQDEPEVPLYRRGDRIVCADGVTRTVASMAPEVAGEPARVIVAGGTEWIAENVRRANRVDVLAAHRRCNAAAARVRTNPDADDPEWKAALAQLTDTLAFLRSADPAVRVALDEEDAIEAVRRVHPGALHFQPVHRLGEDEPVGWTFGVGHGAGLRYGVVSRTAQVSPVGLYEYRTTAERAFHQHEEEHAPR